MNLSPRILGAGAAVLVASVAAGAALGSVPPMQQRSVSELLPEARTVDIATPVQGALPDHYPLVTRAGRVEVADLGLRGLYSQARYNWRAAYAEYYPEDVYVDDGVYYEAEPEPAVARAASAEVDAGWQQAAAAEVESAPLEPVGPVVAELGASAIDVAAELASRQ